MLSPLKNTIIVYNCSKLLGHDLNAQSQNHASFFYKYNKLVSLLKLISFLDHLDQFRISKSPLLRILFLY